MAAFPSLRRWLRGWRAADEAKLAELKQAASAQLDRAVDRYRLGHEPDDAELASFGETFGNLYETLSRRNGTTDNTLFEERDRVDFYVQALKLSALGHPEHDAWPALASIRMAVLDGLLTRLARQEDPWLRLCAVTAALASGSPDRALDSHRRLAQHPFLADLAIRWANTAVICFPTFNPRQTYQTFLAAAATGREDPWNIPDRDAPANRWVLLAAIYPDLSADPRTTLRDRRVAACQRISLQRDWEIVDRESALKQLDWLRTEGHRGALAADLEEGDFDGRPAHARFVAANRAALSRHGILAWDYGRLIGVARSSCAVGYLDEDECQELLASVAASLRQTYRSWGEYGADYTLGAGYFDPEQGEGDAHVAMVRWLMDDPRSPWRRVPFGGPSALN